MNVRYSLSIILGATLGFAVLTVNERPMSGVGLMSQAQAVIGSPLTPFSVAGVGRRTTRRSIYRSYSYNYGYGYGSYPSYAYSSYSYGYPSYGYGYSYPSYSYGSYSYPYYRYGSYSYPYYRSTYAWSWGRWW